MVVRISYKTQNYSKVTKLLVKPKDITLAFRGSRNQRLIDMKKSLKEQEVIELEV